MGRMYVIHNRHANFQNASSEEGKEFSDLAIALALVTSFLEGSDLLKVPTLVLLVTVPVNVHLSNRRVSEGVEHRRVT